MTDHEIEKAYKQMTESEAPDLWGRIEKALPEKTCAGEGEDDMKQNLWSRLRRFLFGGGTFRTAVTVCLMCVIVFGALQQAGSDVGFGLMGASGSKAAAGADMSSAEMKEYASEDAADYAADYGSMQYSGASQNSSVTEEAAPAERDMAAATAETGAAASGENGAGEVDTEADKENGSERKLIRNIYLDVETLEFERLVDELQKKTEALGGYVESSSVSGNSYYYSNSRYADLTLRIPKAKTDEFLEQLGDMANIVSRSENVEDITLTYVDVESHVKALRTEEEQLLKILEQAETVEDIMTIQSRLSEVRYQLESYTSQLKTYDNQVDYDTVSIYISEVKEVTPTEELTIRQQMKKGFADSLTAIGEGFRDFCIWFVAHIPYFVILFVVVLAVTAVVKRRRRRKN